MICCINRNSASKLKAAIKSAAVTFDPTVVVKSSRIKAGSTDVASLAMQYYELMH